MNIYDLLERIDEDTQHLSIEEQLAVCVATKGYYDLKSHKQSMIKTENTVKDNEVELGHSKPCISGIMVKVLSNNATVLTDIDEYYERGYTKQSQNLCEMNKDTLWEMLENTFENSIQLQSVKKFDDINSDKLIIKLHNKEYIIISPTEKNPVFKMYQVGKNIIKKELTANELLEIIGDN